MRRMPIWYTILIGGVLAGATAIVVWYTLYETSWHYNDYIARDVAQLHQIFADINGTCSIISFDRIHNYVDFLNVVAYKGSEVGPMNLRYPDYWQGPYVTRNPTIQGVYYMILAHPEGYFLVPGEGVTLSSGEVIGEDIVLNRDTDIQSLLDKDGAFVHEGYVLARQIPVDGL